MRGLPGLAQARLWASGGRTDLVTRPWCILRRVGFLPRYAPTALSGWQPISIRIERFRAASPRRKRASWARQPPQNPRRTAASVSADILRRERLLVAPMDDGRVQAPPIIRSCGACWLSAPLLTTDRIAPSTARALQNIFPGRGARGRALWLYCYLKKAASK